MAAKYPGSPERINELLGELHTLIDGLYASFGNSVETGGTGTGPNDGRETLLARLNELTEEWKLTGLGRLHAGEPYFLLRGQDKLAPLTIEHYASLTYSIGNTDHAQQILGQAEYVSTWQLDNLDVVKEAD